MLAHWVTWVFVGYLSGSIPFALIVGRTRGVDIREHGSGNVGATNVGRVLGTKWGILCFVLDMGKGLVPVLTAGLFLGYLGDWPGTTEAWAWLAVAAASLLGHIFPVWLRFKGGKGVATGLGALLGFWPVLTIPGVLAAVIWGVVVKATGYVGLASVAAAGSIPLFVAGIGAAIGPGLAPTLPFVTITGLMAGLVVFRHRGNLSRLWAGTELRVSSSERDAPKNAPPRG